MNPMRDIFGASLVGIVLAAAFLGILTLQTWAYFQNYPQDRWWIKSLVGSVWTADTVQLVLSVHMIYGHLVDGFGNTEQLEFAVWSYGVVLGLSTVITTLVQLFFARRVFLVSKKGPIQWIATGAVLGLLTIHFVLGMMVAASVGQVQTFVGLGSEHEKMLVSIWLGAASISDMLIAGFMCWFLNTSRTGFKSTNDLINKLMSFSIQTGLITFVTQVISLITFAALGFNFVHVFLSYPISGLYAVSLLANLHTRQTEEGASWAASTSANIIELSGVSQLSSSQRPRPGTKAPMEFTTTTTFHDDLGNQIEPDEFKTHSPSLELEKP